MKFVLGYLTKLFQLRTFHSIKENYVSENLIAIDKEGMRSVTGAQLA
jgi:hypothetical protein